MMAEKFYGQLNKQGVLKNVVCVCGTIMDDKGEYFVCSSCGKEVPWDKVHVYPKREVE